MSGKLWFPAVIAGLTVVAGAVPLGVVQAGSDTLPDNRENNAVILDARNSVMSIPGGLLVNGTDAIIVVHHISILRSSPVKLLSPITDTIFSATITNLGAYFLDVPLDEDGEWVLKDNLNVAITKFTVVTWESGTPLLNNSHVNVFPIPGSFGDDIRAIYGGSADLTPNLEGDLDLEDNGDCGWSWDPIPDSHSITTPGPVAVRKLWITGYTSWSCGYPPIFTLRFGLFTPPAGQVVPSSAGARFTDYSGTGEGQDLMVYAVVGDTYAGQPASLAICGVFYGTAPSYSWTTCDTTYFHVY